MTVLGAVEKEVKGQDDLVDALLRATHAALFGYGVLGPRLDAGQQKLAREADDVLRSDRDTLAGLLRGANRTVPGPLAAYDVAVADRAAAFTLAVRLEAGLALRWGDLVGGTDDGNLRIVATAGVRRSAVRAAQWRVLQGAPATVAFPGQV